MIIMGYIKSVLKVIFLTLIIAGLTACSPDFSLTHSDVQLYVGQSFDPYVYVDENVEHDKLNITHNVSMSIPGEYDAQYEYENVKRNLKVTVLPDPIVLSTHSLSLETGDVFSPLSYLNPSSKTQEISVVNNVNTDAEGDYIVIYSFSGIEKILNVSVKDLKISIPNSNVIIDLGSNFNPNDYIEVNIENSKKLSITNNVDSSKVGQYQVTYSNGSENKILDVTVKDASPFLTKTEVSIKQGSAFNPKDYLIQNDRDNANIIITNTVNTSKAGDYVVTYKLGSVEKTLTVTVTAVTVVTNPSYKLTVVSLTSPVSPNENATIVVQGKAGQQYSIVVNYKSGPSTAAGLEPKVAGSDGRVSWTWKIGARTTAGDWRITISGDSRTVSAYITVR
jgi:hypothetical protein